MSRYILDITDSEKANHLIRYIQSLDFVEITEDDACELTDAQKKAIDEALEELDAGKGIPHEEVMRRTREKFPHLFSNET